MIQKIRILSSIKESHSRVNSGQYGKDIFSRVNGFLLDTTYLSDLKYTHVLENIGNMCCLNNLSHCTLMARGPNVWIKEYDILIMFLKNYTLAAK